jgi:hypothetical protein
MEMSKLKLALGVAASMGMDSFFDPSPSYSRGRSYTTGGNRMDSYTKKGPGRRPTQGDGNKTHAARYYGKHSHVLTEYEAGKNLASMANRKTGFKGFRKVRMMIAPPFGRGPHLSVWRPVGSLA